MKMSFSNIERWTSYISTGQSKNIRAAYKTKNKKMHDHRGDHKMTREAYSIRDFFPLILLFSLVIFFVVVRQFFFASFELMQVMRDFMGAFFVFFAFMKIINLPGFVESYQTYDIVAKRSKTYAYMYPFIEVTIGLFLIFEILPIATLFAVVAIMGVSIIGVTAELLKGSRIQCACLGVVFTVPMTWVTFIENMLMILMALTMIAYAYIG